MSRKKKIIGTSLAIGAGVVGALLILAAWKLPPFQGSIETTENAYVRGSVTVISPQVAGYVTTVKVRDFQTVKAGDLLVQIDDRVYRQRLMQAKATLAARQAALKNSQQSERAAQSRIRSSEAQIESARAASDLAKATLKRVEPLARSGASSQSALDSARAAYAQAEAGLHQAEAVLDVARQELQSVVVNRDSLLADIQNAEAAVELAQIDLQNSTIISPVDGRLGEIGVKMGQYVSAGTQLAAIVPEQRWVMANFKETQVSRMRVGQAVTFTADALDHGRLRGTIESLSPAAGSEFSVIKSDNATGNFTKVSQRIPVRIAIAPDQPLADRLSPGMSVVVDVDTRSTGSD